MCLALVFQFSPSKKKALKVARCAHVRHGVHGVPHTCVGIMDSFNPCMTHPWGDPWVSPTWAFLAHLDIQQQWHLRHFSILRCPFSREVLGIEWGPKSKQLKTQFFFEFAWIENVPAPGVCLFLPSSCDFTFSSNLETFVNFFLIFSSVLRHCGPKL